jgi:sialic acid synthase SpsE
MNTLKEEFGCKVGYSDHSLGIEIPIAAVAKGATIIEKHFTLDKSLPGPDHKASLNPKELRDMIKAIRNVELALGHSEKKPTSSEVENRRVARKSIHFASNLNQGETLNIEHLSIKRPGDGIAPKDINNLIGKTLTSAVFEDQKVEWNHVQ